MHEPFLVSLLVRVHFLTDIFLAIFEQAINALGDLAGGGDDRFGATRARSDAAIESAQGVVRMGTALGSHAQRFGRAIAAAANVAAFDLAA